MRVGAAGCGQAQVSGRNKGEEEGSERREEGSAAGGGGRRRGGEGSEAVVGKGHPQPRQRRLFAQNCRLPPTGGHLPELEGPDLLALFLSPAISTPLPSPISEPLPQLLTHSVHLPFLSPSTRAPSTERHCCGRRVEAHQEEGRRKEQPQRR